MRTLFSASRGAHLLFTNDWARLHNFYNVVVEGSPVLHTTSLLPSQPEPVPIYTPGSRGASKSKVPCSRVQHGSAQKVQTHNLIGIMSPEFYCWATCALPIMWLPITWKNMNNSSTSIEYINKRFNQVKK